MDFGQVRYGGKEGLVQDLVVLKRPGLLRVFASLGVPVPGTSVCSPLIHLLIPLTD